MAIVSTPDATLAKLSGKTLSVQSLLTSQVQISLIDVAIGASDNYATNGITVDLSANGRIATILAAVVVKNDTGCLAQYVPAAAGAAATGKLKLYGVDPAAAGGAVVAFVELPNASTATNSKNVQFLVIGY